MASLVLNYYLPSHLLLGKVSKTGDNKRFHFSPHPVASELLREKTLPRYKNTIIAYRPIDAEVDNYLYPLAMGISKQLVEILNAKANASNGNAWLRIDPTQKRPFTVMLADRLVSTFRGPYQMMKHDVHFDDVHVVGMEGRFSRDIEQVFRINALLNSGKTNLLEVAQNNIIDGDKFPAYVKSFEQIEDWREVPPYAISTVVNVTDHNYRKSLYQICEYLLDLPLRLGVARMTEQHDAEDLWRHAFKDEPHQNKFWVRDFVQTSYKVDLMERRSNERSISDLLADAGNTWIAQLDSSNHELIAFVPLLCTFLQRSVPNSYSELKRRSDQAALHIKGSSCFVALPGRSLLANLCVEKARQKDIPTIEIQCGTMSRNPRYYKPGSKYVLAMDEYSRSIYTEYLGIRRENCVAVGSSKIDFDLKEIRMLDASKCFAKVADDFATEVPPLLFASQPVGQHIMGPIVELLVEAAKKLPRSKILIKPHPKDPPAYSDHFNSIIRKHKCENVSIVKDVDLYTLVKGSAGVATYFSTVGLEGYSLGKPVARINPFEENPGYNLVEMGVAEDIKTPNQLVDFIRRATDEFYNPKDVGQIKEPYLRDGLAGKRCADFIFERAREYTLLKTGIDVAKFTRVSEI